MQFQHHKNTIFTKMQDNSILLLQSAEIKMRSNDTDYPFRQNSNFYYATGFLETDAIVVLIKRSDMQKSIIFVHEKDPLKELWAGEVLGVEAAKESLGMDEAYSINLFEEKLPELLQGLHHIYLDHAAPKSNSILAQVQQAKNAKEKFAQIDSVHDVNALLFELRRTKSAWEIEKIKQALQLTTKAHHAAMAMASSSSSEYKVMALIEYIFKSGGASGDAYTTIVAGGNSANTLHYVKNNRQLRDGEMVLIDAGAEFDLYASDITRSFPINGGFTTPQRELYTIVLEAQKAAFKAIKPGGLRSHVNQEAIKVLSQGLIDSKILHASLDEAIEKELYKVYYPHGIGHWMGLDVHDPLAYKDKNGFEIPFVEGDVLTIEPGLYLNANNPDVPDAFKGIGIRIEDDILVTSDGYENLSTGIAKEINEIEEACRKDIYDFI